MMIFNVYDFTLKWGYLGLFLTSAIENEAVAICISSLYQTMHFNLFYIFILSFIGTFLGAFALFFIGKFFKDRLLKIIFFKNKVDYLNTKIEIYGVYFIVFFRFIYGIKLASPMILGFSNISIKYFFIYNLVGAFLWSLIMVLIGWFLSFFCFTFSLKLVLFIYALTIIVPFVIGFLYTIVYSFFMR